MNEIKEALTAMLDAPTQDKNNAFEDAILQSGERESIFHTNQN